MLAVVAEWAPRAIAEDPVIDRVPSEVAFHSQDINGWRLRTAYRKAAQPPDMDFGWKSITHQILGYHFEDGLKPLPPGFELISRAEGPGCKTVWYHEGDFRK